MERQVAGESSGCPACSASNAPMESSGPLLGSYNPGQPPPGGEGTEGMRCLLGMPFRVQRQGGRGDHTAHRPNLGHGNKGPIPPQHAILETVYHTPQFSLGEAEMTSASTLPQRSWRLLRHSTAWGPASPNLTPISTWNSPRNWTSKV